MRRWLAEKLFEVALRLDWNEVLLNSITVLMAEIEVQGVPVDASEVQP